MINPRSVMIATPSYDGTVVTGYAGGLAGVFSSGFAGNVCYLDGCADIGSARAQMVHAFLSAQDFEYLVFIDADIQFTARDFGILMMIQPDEVIGGDKICYSRVPTNPHGKSYKANDPRNLMPELLVCAEYSFKNETADSVRFGLGFTRIHRSVFKILAEMVDDNGEERVDQFFFGGQMIREYFPMCTLGDGRRVGEDGGFWTLCKLAGLSPRIEQGTRLVHWGRKAYPYQPPAIRSVI